MLGMDAWERGSQETRKSSMWIGVLSDQGSNHATGEGEWKRLRDEVSSQHIAMLSDWKSILGLWEGLWETLTCGNLPKPSGSV